MNTYVAPLSTTSDLGCGETFKLAFDVKHVSGYNSHFSELHFVDSARFTQVGKTFGEWAGYISDLGTETFNVYMHNKMVMYVPDVTLLFRKLQAANQTAYYHLSMSPGSTTYDVAHVGVPIFEAVTIFEIVGPSSYFTESELTKFTPWTDVECGDVNSIKKTLTDYQALYDDMTTTDLEVSWFNSAGLHVPMGIAIHMAISSLDVVASHAEAGSLITGGSMRTDTISDTCSTITVDLDRSEDDGIDGYNPVIKYIANTAANQGGVFTLADWETEVEATHDYYLTSSDSANFNSWDRYLDHHIGIITEPDASDVNYCTDSKAYFEAVLSAYDLSFAPRLRLGATTFTNETHYYTGFNGVRSWEFNVEDCHSDEFSWGICGCIASNNDEEYELIYGDVCTISITEAEY